MSLSLKSGLPFDRCIELSKELIYDKHFQKEINDCQNLLDEGSSLANLFMIVIFLLVFKLEC